MYKHLAALLLTVIALSACEPTGRYRDYDSGRSPSYGNSFPSGGHSH